MEHTFVVEEAAISVLGAFEVAVNGCQVGLALREMRLLALLTLTGTSRRDFISGTLWPETTQERAAASLRVAVHNIRRVMPDLLEVSRHMIGLCGHVKTDLDELRRVLAETTSHPVAADLGRTLTVLSSGDLLPGWRDDWVIHERERMRHRRIRALTSLGESCLEVGDSLKALAAATAAEQLEPLRERTHLLAIRAMVSLGLDEQARKHYRRFVDVMEGELGLRPSDRFLGLIATG